MQAQAFPPGTPGPFKIRNAASGLCLDSSTDGNYSVYHGRCNSSDPGQRWGWFNGGWLINLHTGLCVRELRIGEGTRIQMGGCHYEASYYWIHRNQAIQSVQNGTCVSSGPEGAQIQALPCRTTLHQAWSVWYW